MSERLHEIGAVVEIRSWRDGRVTWLTALVKHVYATTQGFEYDVESALSDGSILVSTERARNLRAPLKLEVCDDVVMLLEDGLTRKALVASVAPTGALMLLDETGERVHAADARHIELVRRARDKEKPPDWAIFATTMRLKRIGALS